MYLYSHDDPTLAAKLRLDRDVIAIDNDRIIEISQVARRSHQIVTRIKRQLSEPMVSVPSDGSLGDANKGCRTQPYFWSRWDDKYWTDVSFAVETGSISESLTDDTSRSLSLTVHSDYWTSFEEFQTEISPFNTLLRVERGIRVADSTSEDPPSPGESVVLWCPLGIYRVHKADFDRDHTATIQAYSLEQILKDFLYETPPPPLAAAKGWMGLFEEKFLSGGIRAGANDWSYVTAEIRDSITPAAAAKVANETYPAGFLVGNGFTRWTGIKEMLDAKHFNLYVNRVGKPIVVRIPEPTDSMTDPSYGISSQIQKQLVVEEGYDGNIISRSEDFNRDGLYNVIIAYGQIAVDDPPAGQAEAAPVIAIIPDDNASSPTYVGGPFGRIAKELQVENLLAAGQLDVAGRSELAKTKILTTRTSLSLLPNPTIEVGDRIQVHYPDGSYRWFIIESADIPLTADSELSVQAYTYDNARTHDCLPKPANFSIASGPNESSVTLHFDAAKDAGTGEKAVGYEWTSDAIMFWNPVKTTDIGSDRVEMVITGLRPLTEYRIKVRSVFPDTYNCPPIVEMNGVEIITTPGTMLVAEAGCPGRFLDDQVPVNMVVANSYRTFHILPPPGSPHGINYPWDPDVYVVTGDGREITWNGGRFEQWGM